MESTPRTTLAPRVLIVMNAQWPRALLRAALREAGYDAVGARDLVEALGYSALAPDRGPVRLVIVDEQVLETGDDTRLQELLTRHHDPAALLLGKATPGRAGGPWSKVLHRPASIGEIVDATRAMVPLPPEASRPID